MKKKLTKPLFWGWNAIATKSGTQPVRYSRIVRRPRGKFHIARLGRDGTMVFVPWEG